MNNIFKIDGLLYKLGMVIYDFLLLNFLWALFSLPLFTIGASTTALFYVIGKIKRKDDYNIISDFWKSFKMNFRQATIIWMILAFLSLILILNIIFIPRFLHKLYFLVIIQYVVLVELIGVFLYIFPLLSRYHITIVNAFKTSFYLTNRYLINTILIFAAVSGLVLIIYWKSFFILFVMPAYAYWVFSIAEKIFYKLQVINEND